MASVCNCISEVIISFGNIISHGTLQLIVKTMIRYKSPLCQAFVIPQIATNRKQKKCFQVWETAHLVLYTAPHASLVATDSICGIFFFQMINVLSIFCKNYESNRKRDCMPYSWLPRDLSNDIPSFFVNLVTVCLTDLAVCLPLWTSRHRSVDAKMRPMSNRNRT